MADFCAVITWMVMAGCDQLKKTSSLYQINYLRFVSLVPTHKEKTNIHFISSSVL